MIGKYELGQKIHESATCMVYAARVPVGVSEEQRQPLKKGQHVKIIKRDSRFLGSICTVEADWRDRVKVKVVEGEDAGKIKSYQPEDLATIGETGAAASDGVAADDQTHNEVVSVVIKVRTKRWLGGG